VVLLCKSDGSLSIGTSENAKKKTQQFDWTMHSLFGHFSDIPCCLVVTGTMEFYDFPSIGKYWECHHPNWRTPSFFRGVAQCTQPPTPISSTSTYSHCLGWWLRSKPGEKTDRPGPMVQRSNMNPPKIEKDVFLGYTIWLFNIAMENPL